MPRLPDRFDLWVRRARDSSDPARRLDYVLGALVALPAWHFLNRGTREKPAPTTAEIDGALHLLVFSDADRVVEVAEQIGQTGPGEIPPLISIPMPAVLDWCLDDQTWSDLLINPGADAVALPRTQVEAFTREWQARGKRQASGFWIPNLTTEEEDFWQEHGL
jgi:hypothetical protein